MYTPAIQPRFVRTELVVQKQEDKNIYTVVLNNDMHSLQVRARNTTQMNEQEANSLFAACESASTHSMELFSHFSAVSKWFND